MELYHPLDHGQADAVALGVVGAVRLVEFAEDGGLLLLGDVGAGVADRHGQSGPFLLGGDFYGLTLGRELDGIV